MTPEQVACTIAALLDGLGTFVNSFAAERSKILAPTREKR